jgi:hypothetical protein
VNFAGQSKTTDRSATALFQDVEEGARKFDVSLAGFEPASGEVTVVADTTTPKEVKLKPTSPPPPPGPKTGAVGFRVLDATNDSPISGATVNFNGQSKSTDGSGSAIFDGVAEGPQSFTVVHAGHESASGSVTVKANETTPQEVKLKPETDPKKPDHTLVATKPFTHIVNLKDTNFEDEELGFWILRMEIGVTKGGVVYPLEVDWIPKIKNPANKIVKSTPTITMSSREVGGKRSCSVTFKVDVAGPDVSESSGISWKISGEVEKLVTAGAEVNHTISQTSFTTTAKDTWARKFVFTGVDSITGMQDPSFTPINLEGELVIDDDHGHDDLGIDTDWELHTYDGSPKL